MAFSARRRHVSLRRALVVGILVVMLLMCATEGKKKRRPRRGKGSRDEPEVPPPTQGEFTGVPIALLGADEAKGAKTGRPFDGDTGEVLDSAPCVEGSPWTNKFPGGEVATLVAANPAALEQALALGGAGVAPLLASGFDAGFLTPPASEKEVALFGFASVTTRSRKFKAPSLTDAATAAAKDGVETFRELCGTGYISESRKGAALVYKILVSFQDAADRAAWIAATEYDAAAGTVGAQAINVTASFLKRRNHTGEVFADVAVQQFGGGDNPEQALAAAIGKSVDVIEDVVSWSCTTFVDKDDRKACAKQLRKLQTYARKGLAAAVAPLGNDAPILSVVVSGYDESSVKGSDVVPQGASESACGTDCTIAIAQVRSWIGDALRVVDLVDMVRRTCESVGLASRGAFEDLADGALSDVEQLTGILEGCVDHPEACAANVADIDDDAARQNMLHAMQPRPAELASSKQEDIEAWLAKVTDPEEYAAPYCAFTHASKDEEGEVVPAVVMECDKTPWGMRDERSADTNRRLRNDNMYNYKDNPIGLVIQNNHPGVVLRPHNSSALNKGKTWPEHICWDGDCGGGKPPAWIDKAKVHLIDPEKDEEHATVEPCDAIAIPLIEKHMKSGVQACFAYDLDWSHSLRFLPEVDGGTRDLVDKNLVFIACIANPNVGVRKAFGTIMPYDEFVADDLRWKDIHKELKKAAENPGDVKVEYGHVLTFELDTIYAPTGHPSGIYTLEMASETHDLVQMDTAHDFEL